MNDTDDLIVRAEDSLASAKRSFDHGFGSAYPFGLFEDLLAEVKRLQDQVQRMQTAR